MIEDTAGRMHREKYGKSDKLNAPENQNPEFHDGYRTGVDSLGFDAREVIEEEFLLRVEVNDDLGKGFEEWSRGFWAARSQLIVCPLNRKRRQWGKYFGEQSDNA